MPAASRVWPSSRKSSALDEVGEDRENFLRRLQRHTERQSTMLDASNVPSLIVGLVIGAVTAIIWGRWKNRQGDGR